MPDGPEYDDFSDSWSGPGALSDRTWREYKTEMFRAIDRSMIVWEDTPREREHHGSTTRHPEHTRHEHDVHELDAFIHAVERGANPRAMKNLIVMQRLAFVDWITGDSSRGHAMRRQYRHIIEEYGPDDSEFWGFGWYHFGF